MHSDLREMRDAIDRYKDAADRNLIRVEVGTEGYPPDLDTLVKGVDMVSQAAARPALQVRRIRDNRFAVDWCGNVDAVWLLDRRLSTGGNANAFGDRTARAAAEAIWSGTFAFFDVSPSIP